MFLFLLSYLGILSDWSNILREYRNCTKEKKISLKYLIKNQFKNIITLNFDMWSAATDSIQTQDLEQGRVQCTKTRLELKLQS